MILPESSSSNPTLPTGVPSKPVLNEVVAVTSVDRFAPSKDIVCEFNRILPPTSVPDAEASITILSVIDCSSAIPCIASLSGSTAVAVPLK